ncbi:TonB-dependent receptor [Marinoscillum sp. MHG1-6]|uniref:SusC/RagA family TonB-linked outer membrane protein n=1 Tax=Marinoscillum sp. MHG1-6 TaxID=2959627 RepID=UPI002157F9D6|nr:TonB-dependent receptor [Marinoscillum sp. MHG1-6]
MKYSLFQTIYMVAKHTLYVFVLFVITISSAVSDTVNAQVKSVKDVIVQMESNYATVDNIFDQIESNTDFRFFYTDKGLDLGEEILLSTNKASVAEFLIDIARQVNVEFRQVNNSISVKKGTKSERKELTITIDQSATVTGTITDETGEPLPGATVIVQGTSKGTITDFNGNYSLEVPEGAILEITFIGYEAVTIPVDGRNVINVSLQQDLEQLEEVVVVGYGTSQVKDLTGSVTRVGEESFIKGINASPDQMLQGKVAGVNIVNNSGQPGGAVTFRIRGTSSVRTGQQPLFVVDGVPLDGRNTNPGSSLSELGSSPASNPLSFLNPNDIASIDILKDASATAIYGSRGANGVVIVTTKKGVSGAPKVDVSVTSAVSIMARELDLMDASTWRTAISARGLDAAAYDGGSDVDAFNAITRTGITKTANVSVSGGNDKMNYRVSGGMYDQQGIIKESGLTRYNGSLIASYKFLKNDKLNLDVSLISSRTNENGAPIADNSNINGSLIGNAIEWNPTVPFQDENGLVQESYNSVVGIPTNPLALLKYHRDQSTVSSTLASMGLTWNITQDLSFKVTYGTNQAIGTRNSDLSGELFLSQITDLGYSSISRVENSSNTLNHTLSYNKKFGKLKVNALVGYEYQTYLRFTSTMAGNGFTNFDVWGTDIMGNIPSGNISVSSFRDPTNVLQSYFSRVFLSHSDRYLMTAIFRADGSTKFGENNRYGFFPSFSGAWVLSQESFLKESSVINNLKLRLGWGKTGNQEFPAGAAQERYAYGQGRLALANVANPDLKWETTQTSNLGLDFAIFNSRLSGTIEIFDKNTEDLLFQLNTIQPAPSTSYWYNLPATVNNRGLELSLNSVLVNQPNGLYFDLGVNGTWLKNKLIGYDGVPVATGEIKGNGLGGSGATSQQLADGEPLFVFYMPIFEGFDNDGLATYSDEPSYVGNPNPDFILGINTNLEYKNWSFKMSFNGAFGHQIYNNTENALITASNFVIGRNVSPSLALGEESIANSNTVSTRYLENGDFLRLQNVILSYKFDKIGLLRNLECFVTGQNVFLVTNYSGFDPEVNTNRGFNGVPSFGIEYIPYPMARTFTLGVNMSF